MQQAHELMTVEEVAAYLRVPVGTLYQWHYLGTGPACAKIGRHLRYRRADVEAWVAERVQLDASQHGYGR
jgi:excisionase family DNA binding protein